MSLPPQSPHPAPKPPTAAAEGQKSPSPSMSPSSPTPSMSSNGLPDKLTPGQEKMAVGMVKEHISADDTKGMKGAAMRMGARILQNPLIAVIASVALTCMTGTPISPNHIMEGSRIGEKAHAERKAEVDSEEESKKAKGPKGP